MAMAVAVDAFMESNETARAGGERWTRLRDAWGSVERPRYEWGVVGSMPFKGRRRPIYGYKKVYAALGALDEGQEDAFEAGLESPGLPSAQRRLWAPLFVAALFVALLWRCADDEYFEDGPDFAPKWPG